MGNRQQSEKAMRSPKLRAIPMVEVFPFSGAIVLSEAAQNRLGVKAGERVQFGDFAKRQMFLRKSNASNAYLLRPCPGDENGRVQFNVQTLVKLGVGACTACTLTEGPAGDGWFEIIPTNEMEVRNGY